MPVFLDVEDYILDWNEILGCKPVTFLRFPEYLHLGAFGEL
jgi:hypothetical protein